MTAPSDEPEAGPRLPPAGPMPPPVHTPFLPPPPPRDESAAAAEPAPFDAKAMVESQRHAKENPAYGQLPRSTPASRETARKLREEAGRKRNRNTLAVGLVGLVVFGGLGAAGFFAYRAYQTDQDRRAAEREAALADGDADDADGGLGPLDEQAEIVDGLDALDDPASPSAGGVLDAIDDAQTVVDDLNAPDDTDADGTSSTVAPATRPAPVTDDLALTEALPPDVLATATRLLDTEGFEIYMVEAATFAEIDPDGYDAFLEWVRSHTEVSPDDPVFDILPVGEEGVIGVAVRRNGDEIVRGIIRSIDPDIHIDHTS